MTTWCLIPNLILYFLASLFYLSFPAGKRLPPAFVLTSFGALLHWIYLIYLFFQSQFLPLSFISFGLIVMFLLLAKWKGWEGLGAIFVPLGFVLWVFSLGGEAKGHLFQGLSWLVLLHIFLAIFTFIFMLGNFALGIVFWIQEKGLKEKKWDVLELQLPPLLFNEKLAFLLLRIGFALLTLVLLSGVMLASGRFLHVALAFIAWVFYFFVLMRRWRGFKGRKIVLLSFIGFVSLGLAYLWT